MTYKLVVNIGWRLMAVSHHRNMAEGTVAYDGLKIYIYMHTKETAKYNK